MDGLLLQSAEGLGDGPISGTNSEIWECLQGKKEALLHNTVAEDPLCQTAVGGLQETETSEENWREIEWRRRGRLEARFRKINDAQDHLREHAYSHCAALVHRSTTGV